MQAAQGITKGDVLQRVASIGFVVGGIATVGANALFPRSADPGIIAERLTTAGENESLQRIALLVLIIGFWGLLVGAVGVYRSLPTGPAAAWARLGFYGFLGATTVATASLATGLAATSAAVDWVSAGSTTGSTEYAIAAGLDAIANSMFDVMIVGYWLALAVLGFAIARSDTYPRWLGWGIVALSAVVVAVGVSRLFTDPTQVREIVLAVPAGLTSVWAVVLGIWVTRKAW